SFEDATINMVANLTVQLENFKDKIKQNPEQVNLVHREGYSGGGAMGPFETVIMMLLAAVLYSVRRMKSNR
ncbi:MAG: rhombotail lipoprotein, partial [Psychromonas sp.]